MEHSALDFVSGLLTYPPVLGQEDSTLITVSREEKKKGDEEDTEGGYDRKQQPGWFSRK